MLVEAWHWVGSPPQVGYGAGATEVRLVVLRRDRIRALRFAGLPVLQIARAVSILAAVAKLLNCAVGRS